MEHTLDELIPRYAQNKVELDSYKELCDQDSAIIKKQMGDADLKKYSAGGYVATRSVSVREKVDEDKLIEVIKKHNLPGIVKTKEYVDMQALEKYLYDNELTQEFAEDFSRCREETEVVSLRVKREK